jgi:mRNA-degrading endonuclease RelE of RelBE toxin-antitoxin system
MYLRKFKLVILLAIPADACRRIAGLGENYIVIKVRVKNSNIQKGKSAGYRLVYQVESPISVLLLTIYSKSDRDDISPNEIFNILSSIRDPEQGA